MSFKVAVIQSNFIVGYTEANLERIKVLYEMAVLLGADLVVFPEMAICGYPAEDIVFNKEFQKINMQAIETLAPITTQGAAILIGGIYSEDDKLYNAAFLLDEGKILYKQFKYHLPNHGVFDEKRTFIQGIMPEPVEWRGLKLGLLICADGWQQDVAEHLKQKGAEILISVNAEPFEVNIAEDRESVSSKRAQENNLPLIYVNHVGGQDDLVFDGGSFALSAQGNIVMRMPVFKDDIQIVRLHKRENQWELTPSIVTPRRPDEENIYQAMMLGLRDFVYKNGFNGVLVGMSGGIDSALSAAIAVDALGAEKVRGIMLPSPFTSQASTDDAKKCAELLGIKIDAIPIEQGMHAFVNMLAAECDDKVPDVLSESHQTRLRANILMAISHKDRLLLLNTGNKSEVAVGYTTIYGDMCGHYSVLKDAYKTTVYKLANWRNSRSRVIPKNIITKPPSAELHANQKDQDTLPAYELLDKILSLLVEENLSVDEVISRGFESTEVKHVAEMLFFAEYKRRQSCPGVKISNMAFWRDRRYPISSGWRGEKLPLKLQN